MRQSVRFVRWATAIALCTLGITGPASAQITTGTVSGSVKDSQGGIVPGATVVLISESRGTKSVPAVTNDTGDYVLPNITPDTYTIEISMPGFKTLKRTGVAVSGGDRVAVGSLVIEVGGATETVDVTAEAPLIQASSGERSFTITTSSVENLPLSSRNFASLTQLTPGVSGTTTRLGGGGQNNIMMDGVSTMDTGNNGQMLQMNVEAIAEVKVLTSGYQAEYGRSSGLQITAVTKSGTNRIHGSLYDVERNSDWNENSWVNEKNGLPKTIQKERDWGYSLSGPVGKPGGSNKLFFFYSHEYRPRESGRQVNRFRVPTLAERAGDFSASTDQNGNPIPNLADFTGANGGVFPNKTIPSDRLYQPGLAILKLWPTPNTIGLNYNYEVELPTVNTLIQQPALRLDYQPMSAWRLTGKYAGQMRSHEVNSIGGAAAPGVGTRIPGFNDYVEPYPWIGTISVTNNLTLNATTFLEATYGWVQNQLGSMIITPVSNRFNAGLGDLPLLFPDAGVIDPRYYENKPLQASGTPYFQDGRILLPPTFAWGNRVANAPPNLSFPGFMNINRTQDFSISLTKVWDRHTIKAGFYLNHSYKAQNLGAGGGASFQGNISFANDTANPLDTGFGFANAALGVFTSYQQQSKFVEGSFLYDQVDWYVQDNWKINSKLTLDYGLRFVNQRPQYDQYLQASNFFPERWRAGAAPALYVPGCAGASPCSGVNRQARNPLTGQLLGPNTSLAIGQLVPNSGDPINGIVKAGDGIAKGNYEWPTIGYAPRFGAAYDLTGSQRFIFRGGAGLFFDRPNGNSVFSQVGNPPFSTATTVRYSQLQSLGSGGLTTQGPPSLIVFKYDSELPSSYQWNAGVQFALPWSMSGDVSYVGQHGFNLLQNVDINAVDFGTAFSAAAQDATVAASATPGGSALSVDLLRPYRGFGAIQQNWGIGWNTYHSIQSSFNRRFRNGFSLGLNYTLGLSNTGTAGNPVRLDHHGDGTYSIRADQEEQDELLKDLGLQRHIIKGNMVWDLPKMSANSGATRVLAAVVNDWQLSGILTAGTGAPYSVGFSYAGGAVGNAAGGTNAGGTGNQNLTGSPSYAARVLINGDPGSGCSSNQYAQFNTAAFSVPSLSASNPSRGLESGQNYLHGCFDKTVDLALARNFRLGGNRNIQFRIEAFNAFNALIYNARNTTLQVTSPLNLTQSNPQYDSSGGLVGTRLTPQNAGFGAATGAQAMRSMQAQIRFQF